MHVAFSGGCVCGHVVSRRSARRQRRFLQGHSDDSAAVTKLLQSGADVNVTDDRGDTPLMYAAAVGSEAMMRLIRSRRRRERALETGAYADRCRGSSCYQMCEL